MCLILAIKPGAVIPADKLDLACDINKHGYGICYPQGGKLTYIRNLKEPNDPKEVGDQLQKLKDKHVFLHLRHATVGGVNEENSHPFVILNKKKHSVDVAMMHNGTLFDWKPTDTTSTDSDTLEFARKLVTPLALRVNSFTGKTVLSDEVFKHVIKKEVGYSASVILFVDGIGNTLIFNKDKGKEFEGYWASNDYSFDQQHNRSSSRSTYHGNAYGTAYDYDSLPWERDEKKAANDPLSTWEDDLREGTPPSSGKSSGPLIARTVIKRSVIRTKYECQCVGETIIARHFSQGASVMSAGGITMTKTALKELKTPFIELASIKDLGEVGRLTETDFIEISTNYPKAAARLMVDLLAERAALAAKNNAQAQTIMELTKERSP